MGDPPVRVELSTPPRFARGQLVIRIVLAIVLGWLGITVGWVSWVLYLALPLIAAISIGTPPDDYPARLGPRVWRVLSWLLELSAYMIFLTDRFPAIGERSLQFEVDLTAHPTMGSALVRLLTSIPSAFVLSLLQLISGVFWLISAITVLVAARVPEGILAFQRGLLRWQARLAGYHASLVDAYPPFALDTSAVDDAAARPPGAVDRPAT